MAVVSGDTKVVQIQGHKRTVNFNSLPLISTYQIW